MDEVKESPMDMAANHGPKILKCIRSDGMIMEIDQEILKKSNVVKESIYAILRAASYLDIH